MTAPVVDAGTAQAAQEAVAAALAASLRGVVANAPIGDLRRAVPGIAAVVAALVRRYSAGSVAFAVRHYLAERAAAGVAGRFTPLPAPPVPLRQIGATVDWATQPLWSREPDLAAAERNIIAGAEKLVMDAARDTVIGNVRRDPKAVGWARVTEASPCSFCAMLATRGAVYKSQRTADFKSHDHCRCQATPTFGPYELSPQAAEALDLYRSLPHGSPKAMRAAFRTAWESRATS